MDRYLLDTDTLAGAIKGRLPVVLELARLKPAQVLISVISRFEAEAALRVDPRLQARFGKLLKVFLDSVTVVEFGDEEARQAASLAAYLQASEIVLSPLDLMLSATALARQATLVTSRRTAFLQVPNLECTQWK